jgi:hypothetical protein
MTKWVTRVSTSGAHVSQTWKCNDGAGDGRDGVTPLETCIKELLEPGEQLAGGGFQRAIMRNSAIVGFIQVIDHPPWQGIAQGPSNWPFTRC